MSIVRPLPRRSAVVLGAAVLAGCGGGSKGSDTTSQPAVKLTLGVARRDCPPSDADIQLKPEPSKATVLAPADPIAAVICRYRARRERQPNRLAGALHVGSDQAKRLAVRLDALKPFASGPVSSCPMLGGRSILVVFSYADGTRASDLLVHSGCVPVSNGHIVREGLGLGTAEGHWPDEGLLPTPG